MKKPAAILLLCVCACSELRVLDKVESGVIAPELSMSEDIRPEEIMADALKSDTLKVRDADGREIFIMKAVKDENGEMVASDVIAPVTVSAKFKNVAERHGVVELRFDVTVPAAMMAGRLQMRLSPVLKAMGDSSALAPIFITGEQYRRAQLRGYQRYQRFLQGIVADTAVFIRQGQLEYFIKRNLPEIYALKADSSFVSDEHFASLYGVSQREALEHYTNRFLLRRNRRRKAMRSKMFARYVKAPFVEGTRLDTVLRAENGDFVYNYVHTMPSRPGLRKAEISLSGALYEQDRNVCDLPPTAPLSFYISSLSGLSENIERYISKIIERRVYANTACYVEFATGSSAIDTALGNNASEMGRIAGNLNQILSGEDFEIDSIVVQASCSPEGSLAFNRRLSRARSESVCRHYAGLAERDTLRIEFIPREVPENWSGLGALVEADSLLSASEKADLGRICLEPDLDLRERKLSLQPFYRHLREQIYPRLRVVKFGFHLHRKGMVKDTVHTTEPDTLYRKGLDALKNFDYRGAISLLRPYGDINTAVAYCALDYNASALAVLDSLEDSAKAEYLRALIHARKGEDRKAVECYVKACGMDPSLVHRGNLDPEIAALKNKYKISSQE